ncbi:MAG: hypothetical protein KDA93_16365 [Planctomycetaceae bacterium]|nr:hypothetical protein [Planctomycetaceae bacterium]
MVRWPYLVVLLVGATLPPIVPAQIVSPQRERNALNKGVAVPKRAWGPEQAIGEPDTPLAGDIQTAWASLTEDGQKEWLELIYEKAVIPVCVEIHETYRPGAVFKIAVFDREGVESIVWEGQDPTAAGQTRGVSKIKLRTDIVTDRIRIYLDSPKVPGWNEIDAVGLIGQDADRQWAVGVKASSTYAREIPPQVDQPQMDPFDGVFVGDSELMAKREQQLAALVKQLRQRDEQLRAAQERVDELERENETLKQKLKDR